MTRLCVDTSAYSHFRRGEPTVTRHLDHASWVGVPSVVVGELWTGFLLGSRFENNVADLDEFLSHPMVELLSIDAEVAQIYGEIVVDLRNNGRPVPTNDIWIAATAARAGGAVLTFDDHFREINRTGTVILSAQNE